MGSGSLISLKSGRTGRTEEFSNRLKFRHLRFVTKPQLHETTVAAWIARLVLKLDLLPSSDIANYFLDCLAEHGPRGCFVPRNGGVTIVF